MSTVQMHLPSLGDGDIEGTVLGFMVNEGDDIAEGDIVVEVETDKVVMEIPAEASGKVQSIHLEVGASVKAGALVLDLETNGAGAVDEDEDENENEIYIEVKSTKGKTLNSIIMTDNEWKAAKDKKDKYYIYLVNNVYKDKKIYAVIENVAKQVEEKRFDLLPYSYQIDLSKK